MPLSESRRFDHDLRRFNLMLESGKPFCFARFGDGEHAIANGKPFTSGEGWHVPRNPSWKETLKHSIWHNEPGYYKGIPCPCCVGDPIAKSWLETTPDDHATWANLFVNSNWPAFCKTTLPILVKKKTAIIGNADFVPELYDFDHWIIQAPGTHTNFQTIYDRGTEMPAKHYDVVLVAAGPVAGAICLHLWKKHPETTFIDIGSALDPFLLERQTRDYQDEKTKYAKRTCRWL